MLGSGNTKVMWKRTERAQEEEQGNRVQNGAHTTEQRLQQQEQVRRLSESFNKERYGKSNSAGNYSKKSESYKRASVMSSTERQQR